MEQECQSNNYNTFIDNVLKGENYVYDYYMHYLGKYPNVQYCKMELLPESLIHVLKLNNEDFDEKGIRENIYVQRVGHRPNALFFHSYIIFLILLPCLCKSHCLYI